MTTESSFAAKREAPTALLHDLKHQLGALFTSHDKPKHEDKPSHEEERHVPKKPDPVKEESPAPEPVVVEEKPKVVVVPPPPPEPPEDKPPVEVLH